jgi:hypothetical protein
MKPARIYIEERGDGKLQVVASFRTFEAVLGECPREMQLWLENALDRSWDWATLRPASSLPISDANPMPEEAVR